MMRWIIGSSLKARRVVLAAAVVVMAFGVFQLRDAKVDVLPEFAPPTVLVQTEALGLSSEEVEQLITVPLEQDLLAGVAWADKIRSASAPGLSSIEITFERGTNLYRARQVVQERISQAAGLPNVSRPPQMLQPRSSTSRTAMVSLSSRKLSPIQIGVLARWTLRPRLLAVPGVSNVAVWGQRERQLQVQVDPQKLRHHHVTLQQVIRSTGNALWVSPLTFLEASSPGTGGFIDTPNQRLGIQHNLPIVNARDLGKVSIDETSGAPLVLGDVAKVVEDHQPLIGDAIVNGGKTGAGFQLVVEKLPGANTSDVTKGVEAALDELRPGLSGLQMDTSVFRPATYVDNSVDNLTRWVLIGAVAMLLILAALLFNWRTVLTAVIAIAASFVVAALVLHLAGTTFNAVVFAGLVMAIGAVVHDAVGNVETLTRHQPGEGQEKADSSSAATIVLGAAMRTGRTVLWGTIVFGLALLPLFLMHGLSGDSFFPPLAAACLAALLASLLVAVTVTPALAVLLHKADRRSEPPLARLLQRGHQRALGGFARSVVPAFITICVVLATAAFAIPRLDRALLPQLKDTNLLISWDAPFGTSLPEMDRVTGRAADEVRRLPGVRDVSTQVGQAVLGDQAVGSDSAEMWVSVEPSADYGRTVGSIRRVIAGYPGLSHKVLTYSDKRMREVLSRTSDEITVRLFGSDLGVLHGKADEVKQALSRIDGVRGEHVASQAAEPTMEVQVDLAKARQARIKPGDVRRAAATLLSGIRVGSIFQDQKVYDVQVWSTPETRHSLTSVQNLLVDTPQGGPVRLGDVAAVRVRPTVPVIRREGISRFVDVSANVRGRDVSAVASDLRRSLDRVDFPLEYHAEVLGDYSHQQAARGRLQLFAIAAAVGIFLLLQAAFASWRLAILSFLMLPVAVAGGAVAAWIDGGPMTLATVAGLLSVLAFALRSNIMLVDRFRRLRADDRVPFGPDLVARGTQEQVVPTLTAALTTAGLLVTAIVIGESAGLELVHPIAVVMLGGLVTSTLVTLFVLPALYQRFGPRQEARPLQLEAAPELDVAAMEREFAVAGHSNDPAPARNGDRRVGVGDRRVGAPQAWAGVDRRSGGGRRVSPTRTSDQEGEARWSTAND